MSVSLSLSQVAAPVLSPTFAHTAMKRTVIFAVVTSMPVLGLIPRGAERRRKMTSRSAEDKPEKDFVEKIFGFIFGEIEQEPAGLKRMSVETFPDQYPADISGARAEAVESDDATAARYLRPLLKQTFLEARALRCVYDAERDGWDAAAFHGGVDKKGPAILVATTDDGQVFGGYNSKGWVGIGENRPGLANFLFSWTASSDEFVKLRKVGGAGMATVDLPELGPSFGSEGLVVPLRPEAPRRARVKLGAYYARMPGTEAKTFLKGGAPAVDLASLRCYAGVYAEGEYVPFDDALPFSLT